MRFLDEVEMTAEERSGCVEMCQQFHTTTVHLSQRYLLQLGRQNYVTPTSYLELISTFKMLLDNKRRLGPSFVLVKCKKVKADMGLHWNPSQSYGTSLAIWDLTVLPATRHK